MVFEVKNDCETYLGERARRGSLLNGGDLIARLLLKLLDGWRSHPRLHADHPGEAIIYHHAPPVAHDALVQDLPADQSGELLGVEDLVRWRQAGDLGCAHVKDDGVAVIWQQTEFSLLGNPVGGILAGAEDGIMVPRLIDARPVDAAEQRVGKLADVMTLSLRAESAGGQGQQRKKEL